MSSPASRPRVPVAVLGATGTVGQRFVARLVRHPWFELVELAASERSEGKRYDEACAWRLAAQPEWGGRGAQKLVACQPDAVRARIVFSALDAGIAREVEPSFARAGAVVFSNASAFRMEADVPLLVPEVNPEHIGLVAQQRTARGWSGAIVCNPNCSAAILATALAPLHQRFGIEACFVATMQAVSGAGYPGVPSLDALGNVIPRIGGEEEKLEAELCKLLGTFGNKGIERAPITASAACHRVAVVDGHSEAVSLKLRGSPSLEAVAEALASWLPLPQQLQLPSAPPAPVIVHTQPDRPQPRLDVERDEGMSVHVGRIRACNLLGTKLFVLGHNVERGAAGASVLNAELFHARGLLPG